MDHAPQIFLWVCFRALARSCPFLAFTAWAGMLADPPIQFIYRPLIDYQKVTYLDVWGIIEPLNEPFGHLKKVGDRPFHSRN
jgi:hypothetical protein